MRFSMDKTNWPAYLASRTQVQISLEAVTKAQNWALALLGFMALGFGLAAISTTHGRQFILSSKILFLALFHLGMLAAFYGPALLQKGRNHLAHLLGIRDFAGLILMAVTLSFYAMVAFMLSSQLTALPAEGGFSGFFVLTAWVNFLLISAYCLFSLFCFAGLLFFPQWIVKMTEWSSRSIYAGLALHGLLFLMLGAGYGETAALGSAEFFEHFRIAGLFWVFIGSSIFLVSRLLRPSAVAPLTALELEVVSGRLQNHEAILARFKDAFVSGRFHLWLHRISHDVAAKSHEIATLTHDAVTHVDHEKPSELDLRQVEERYRRAEALYKSLEKENQRFMVSLVWFDLGEAEREKAEILRDLFSRELRNAKLELAQVRKRIDERLVSLKPAFTRPSLEKPAAQIPLEEAPASR
jgi:hypothetical protein